MKNYSASSAIVLSLIALLTGVFGLMKTPQLPDEIKGQIEQKLQQLEKLGSSGATYFTELRAEAGIIMNGLFLSGGPRGGGQFMQATTTVCSIISPNSTTTYLGPFVNIIKNATTTNRIMYIASSTVPYATTSLIWTQNPVLGNTKDAFSVPSATTSVKSAPLAPPNTYFTVSFQGGNQIWGVGTTSELDGFCSIYFFGAAGR